MNAFTDAAATRVVGRSLPHDSARLHVLGQALYIDDLPELAGTLHAAVGMAPCAHGRLRRLDLTAVRAAPGVVSVLTAADIPGANNCGPIVHDEPLLADELIQFHGQPLFVVAASSHDAARRAARLARIEVDALPPVLGIEQAIAAQSWVLPPVTLQRGDADAALAAAPRRLAGETVLGGQEHFYLEGQISYAQPGENRTLQLWCSTQHPTEMQTLLAEVLGWEASQINVSCRRMGGGFGGKESQSAQWACLAGLLAVHTGRPVKLRLDRDDDMMLTGKRHPFRIRWEAGFDDDGLLLGVKYELASDCGFSADLSGPVNDRAICHVDNAYYLDAVSILSLRCKTHTVSHTAFRGFGGPQGMMAIESVLDDIARELGHDPLAVRCRNFYGTTPGGPRSLTHYQMPVSDNILPQLVAQLAADSRYHARRQAIADFNAASPVLKKGIALTPVKFGISFNAVHYNQAGALVHVYTDGSVLVTHGGNEMGQGLYTKIRQIVAEVFGLAPERIRLAPTETSRVPNTSATAASSGADLNGKAAQDAALTVRRRLADWLAAQQAEAYAFQAYAADVADWESCQRMAARIAADGHQVDIVVNNAGITRDATLRKLGKDGWDAVLRTNLDSVFHVTKPFLDGMLERGWGRVINISSINGLKGQFGQTNYSAAKAGMHGFTKALAQEVARKGVTVNTVSPGYLATQMVTAVPPDVLQQIVAGIPVGRLGQPAEIAALVTFIASEAAGFMTGSNISMNGGQYMG